jgi:hypothetical protein
MEGYTLCKENKQPSNKQKGLCLACEDSKPKWHKSCPQWYSFNLHKAAGSDTWQYRLGAQAVQPQQLPDFLVSFVSSQQQQLAQTASQSPQQVTLYVSHPKKHAV